MVGIYSSYRKIATSLKSGAELSFAPDFSAPASLTSARFGRMHCSPMETYIPGGCGAFLALERLCSALRKNSLLRSSARHLRSLASLGKRPFAILWIRMILTTKLAMRLVLIALTWEHIRPPASPRAICPLHAVPLLVIMCRLGIIRPSAPS